MIRVNSEDSTTQIGYNRRQGRKKYDSFLCINKNKCRESFHFYAHYPNIESDEAYYRIWADWARKKERIQVTQ